MRVSAVSSATFVTVVVLSACSPGASANGDAAASGSCNNLTHRGSNVPDTASASAAPAMTGGTIVDGTYVLTSNVEYGSASAGSAVRRRTLAIQGTTLQMINSDNGGADVSVTMTIAPSGNSLNETATCPAGVTITRGTYTATATTLMIQKNGTSQVATYTKL